MNWSSVTLRSCYILLIHTPLCCKTLEQLFVHLPSFVCILPHFSLTEHPFLCRQGYYYIPPLTDRKTETLQRLDDSLPSHISTNGNRKQVSWLVGEESIFFVTWQIQPPKSCPFNSKHMTPHVRKKHWHFFLTADPRHCPKAGWWQLYNPWGPPTTPQCPQAVLTWTLLLGAFPLFPFLLMYGRTLETLASSWPHLRTAYWCKPQHIKRASMFYHEIVLQMDSNSLL